MRCFEDYNWQQPVMPSDPQDQDEEDPREILYNEYALPHESFEDFCDFQAEMHGVMWVPFLMSRRGR